MPVDAPIQFVNLRMKQVNFTNIENTLSNVDSFFARPSLKSINIWVDTLMLPLDRFQSLSETF